MDRRDAREAVIPGGDARGAGSAPGVADAPAAPVREARRGARGCRVLQLPGSVESVFAVGDVHGRDDLLADLHAAIAAEMARGAGTGRDAATEPSAPRAAVVHLGDLIDRGPASAGAVRRARIGFSGARFRGGEVALVTLRGNHEDMLLGALGGAAVGAPGAGAAQGGAPHGCWIDWVGNGGEAALASWGVRTERLPSLWGPAEAEAAAALLRGSIPPADLDFLAAAPLCAAAPGAGVVLVHAGLRPGVRIAEQSDEDFLWIREAFLDAPPPPPPGGPTIVHGHTQARGGPDVQGHRVNLDTAAVAQGVLTCGVFRAGADGPDFLVAAAPRRVRLLADPEGLCGAAWARWAVALLRADRGAEPLVHAPRGGALRDALDASGLPWRAVDHAGRFQSAIEAARSFGWGTAHADPAPPQRAAAAHPGPAARRAPISGQPSLRQSL